MMKGRNFLKSAVLRSSLKSSVVIMTLVSMISKPVNAGWGSSVVIMTLVSMISEPVNAGWGYIDQSGWSALHNTSCGGNHQSPIDLPNVCSPINSNVTNVNPGLNLRLINYDMQMPPSLLSLRNNGHTAVVSLMDSRRPNAWLPKISGSVVGGDKYQLLQLHFHWDSNKNSHIGSEHALHGKRRAFEMHLVHFNTRYPDPTEAGLHPDGFAVLGTFFDDVEDDEYNNQELNKIVLQLREISEFNTSTTMKRSLNLRNLLPRDIDTFYTYQGSLTTPPCSEIITWIIFPESQKIGPQQLFNFERALDTYSDQGSKEVLSETCRDLQPLNDRIVYSSSDSHCRGSTARPATSLILENLPSGLASNLVGQNRGQSSGTSSSGTSSSGTSSSGQSFSSSSSSPSGSYRVPSSNSELNGRQQYSGDREQYNNYQPEGSNGNYRPQGSNGNYGSGDSRPDRYYYSQPSPTGSSNGREVYQSAGRPGGRVEIVYGGTKNPVGRPGLVGGLVGRLLG